MGDAGLTGRKIIVDTYGGMARHGGGAFSGKDPSKVDRSAAYAMRWVAKNVVAAGLAERCEVQVAYAIGKAAARSACSSRPSAPRRSPVEQIEKAIDEVFDLRPAAIIRDLDLLRPIYPQTAAYGHFGRELPDFTWERTDRVDDAAQGRRRLTPPGRHCSAAVRTDRQSVRCPRRACQGSRAVPCWTPAGRRRTPAVSVRSGRTAAVSSDERGVRGAGRRSPPEQLALHPGDRAQGAAQPRAKPRTWRGAALAEELPGGPGRGRQWRCRTSTGPSTTLVPAELDADARARASGCGCGSPAQAGRRLSLLDAASSASPSTAGRSPRWRRSSPPSRC